jgi:putative two-component system response regulator
MVKATFGTIERNKMASTVLIVDDERMGRETIESILDGQGYKLELAENGIEAIEKARRFQPDVILLDVMMPGMTGFEVCAEIRNDRLTAEIPIIFLTALDDKNTKLQGLQSGADDYITKPCDRHELRARLQSITRLNRYRKLLEERENVEHEHAKLLAAYDATIVGWSRAMEMRDKETEGHAHRVTQLTLTLAREMGIGGDDLVHIRRGALLHDMGKLGVPDSILHKMGTLTSDEWRIMRQHPQYAYDMLAPIEYLHPALEIPYCHHERWDGTGYPRGLKGGEIPLSARIFAIADVWDALTTDRPYRTARDETTALEYLRAQSGKHFDPQMVELFCKVMGCEVK